MKREEAAKFVQQNILGSCAVQEILMVNRQRLSALVEAGKLTPIKELKRESLFWLPDVLHLRNEMLLDTRTNLFKNAQSVSKDLRAVQSKGEYYCMAKCEICEQDMMKAKGCHHRDYLIDGIRYEAIPHNDYYQDYDDCGDCGVRDGEPHHIGCDQEECPACGFQFITCECTISNEIFIYPNGRKSND